MLAWAFCTYRFGAVGWFWKLVNYAAGNVEHKSPRWRAKRGGACVPFDHGIRTSDGLDVLQHERVRWRFRGGLILRERKGRRVSRTYWETSSLIVPGSPRQQGY